SFLLALPIAAAPLVLHLLRKRQRQVVSWGAMQFLADAVGEGKRFERLEEILLLALRVLAILALVFALARPQVASFLGAAGMPASREVALVIDDSLSNGLGDDDSNALSAIVQEAKQFIDAAPPGAAMRIMLASEGPRWLLDQPVNNSPG